MRISRSVFEGPFDFEIARVNCNVVLSDFLILFTFQLSYLKLLISQSKFLIPKNLFSDITCLGWALTLRYQQLTVFEDSFGILNNRS